MVVQIIQQDGVETDSSIDPDEGTGAELIRV